MKTKSAILQMYYMEKGNYNTVKMSEEEKRLQTIMSSLQAELKEKLYKQPEVLELHQKFCDIFDGLLVEESENLFVEGFRFGFLMALDVFEI